MGLGRADPEVVAEPRAHLLVGERDQADLTVRRLQVAERRELEVLRDDRGRLGLHRRGRASVRVGLVEGLEQVVIIDEPALGSLGHHPFDQFGDRRGDLGAFVADVGGWLLGVATEFLHEFRPAERGLAGQ